MKLRWILPLLILAVVLSGCAGQQAPASEVRPEVTVTLSLANEYEAAALLRDDAYREALGDAWGVTLILQEENTGDPGDIAGLSPFDILITDDAALLVGLSSEGAALELTGTLDMAAAPYGRSGGRQYGYVFQEPGRVPQEPQLVVNTVMLENAGIQSADFTPEGFRTVLEALADHSRMPLAVYGSPSGAGFGALLGLFSLTPQGGHEFYLEDGTVAFDKTGARGAAYLEYVYSLYLDGLIPGDCLSLSQYSCRSMFVNKRCAMTVAPNREAALSLVEYAAEHGVEAAVATLPVAEGLLETHVYERTVSIISSDCPDGQQMLEMMQQLQQDILALEAAEPSALPTVRLFSGSSPQSLEDPVLEVLADMRILYEKQLLDAEVIAPYYSRLAVGSLPLEQFDSIHTDWLNLWDDEDESVEDNVSGDRILQVLQGWVERAQKMDRK